MRNKVFRPVGVLATGALALAGLAACGGTTSSNSSSKGPLIVGQVTALTGQFSVLGVPEADGAKGTVAWLNAHGGILGHKIKFFVGNDQSTSQEAATVAKQLITQDHVSILLGPEETSEIGAVANVAAAYHVIDLQNDPFQTWPPAGISMSKSALEYSFPEIMAFDSTNASSYQSAVWKPKSYTRIALLTDSTPFGMDMISPLEQVAKADGFTVVGVKTFTVGATDVTPQVESLLSKKPQFLLDWTAPGPDTTVAVKTIRSLSPSLPVGISGGQDTPATVTALGKAAAESLYAVTTVADGNVVNSLQSSNPQKSVAEEFTRVMKAEHVNTANGANTAYQGFDCLYLIQNAIDAAKSTATPALLTALSHQSIAGITNVWKRTPSDHGGYVKLSEGYVVQYDGSAWKYVTSS